MIRWHDDDSDHEALWRFRRWISIIRTLWKMILCLMQMMVLMSYLRLPSGQTGIVASPVPCHDEIRRSFVYMIHEGALQCHFATKKVGFENKATFSWIDLILAMNTRYSWSMILPPVLMIECWFCWSRWCALGYKGFNRIQFALTASSHWLHLLQPLTFWVKGLLSLAIPTFVMDDGCWGSAAVVVEVVVTASRAEELVSRCLVFVASSPQSSLGLF